jgi:hypothetical protein
MLKPLNRLLYLFFCLALCTSSSAFAVQKEYVLKAGFLYNFARLGQWQSAPENGSDFLICSPDSQFIAIANAALENRKVHERHLRNKLTPLETTALEGCDIVFITDNTYNMWLDANPALNLKNTMIVGETDGFIAAQGHIRFFLSSSKVRFEVAPSKLKKAGITMSSKVLRLARVVEG